MYFSFIILYKVMKNKTKSDQSTNKKLFVMNPGQLNVISMID